MKGSTQLMINKIEELLMIKFNDRSLIENAFFHTTYVNEKPWLKLVSNERLEFLGDAVLELTVSDFLYHQYPNLPEGQLTTMRAQLVQEGSLAYLSRQLKLDDAIYLGKGEIASGGRTRDSIISDAYEALLGAIYLDQGIEIATKFVTITLLNQHQEMIQSISQDYKTKLQELVQQKGAVKIRYDVVEQKGPAHDTQFTVQVMINDEPVAKGQGRSKKQAEIEAAKEALTHIDEKGNIF